MATGRRLRQKVIVGWMAMVPGRHQRLLVGRSGGEGAVNGEALAGDSGRCGFQGTMEEAACRE